MPNTRNIKFQLIDPINDDSRKFVEKLNEALDKIDSHSHSGGTDGLLISSDSIEYNSNADFQNNDLTNVGKIRFSENEENSIFLDANGDLILIRGSGEQATEHKLTQNGVISISTEDASNFSGLFTSSTKIDLNNNIWSFFIGENTLGDVRARKAIVESVDLSSTNVTIKSTDKSVEQNIVIPQNPDKKSSVNIDESGNIFYERHQALYSSEIPLYPETIDEIYSEQWTEADRLIATQEATDGKVTVKDIDFTRPFIVTLKDSTFKLDEDIHGDDILHDPDHENYILNSIVLNDDTNIKLSVRLFADDLNGLLSQSDISYLDRILNDFDFPRSSRITFEFIINYSNIFEYRRTSGRYGFTENFDTPHLRLQDGSLFYYFMRAGSNRNVIFFLKEQTTDIKITQKFGTYVNFDQEIFEIEDTLDTSKFSQIRIPLKA